MKGYRAISQDWYFTKYPPVIWWVEFEVRLKLEKIIIKNPYDVIHRNVKRFDHQTTRFVSIKQIFVRIRSCAKYVFGEICSHLPHRADSFFVCTHSFFSSRCWLVRPRIHLHAFIKLSSYPFSVVPLSAQLVL